MRLNAQLRCLLLLSLAVRNVMSDVATELVRNVPPLYKLDDYEKCNEMAVADSKSAIYCIVKSVIKPNPNAESWHLIKVFPVIESENSEWFAVLFHSSQEYSRNVKLSYQYDMLERGVCLTLCQKMISDFDTERLNDLYQEKIDKNQKVSFLMFQILP